MNDLDDAERNIDPMILNLLLPTPFSFFRPADHAYSVPACWFRSTAVIMRVAVALNAARKSKLASTPAGPSIGVLASARYTSCSVMVRLS